MDRIAGCTPADYLIQHAARERRNELLPASTWDAILTHITDPADTARLAGSADRRLLLRYAIPLYRHADAGDKEAAGALGWLLAQRGDLDQLRARADAGDWRAALDLARLLAELGDLDELHARAVAGNWRAGIELPKVLVMQGRHEEAERLRRFGLNPDGSTAHA
jgi:hypothetical protein